jgi:hypothetical protein
VWENTLDEISRAQGNGSTGAFFGLPVIEVEDLTTTPASSMELSRSMQTVSKPAGPVMAVNGNR